MRIAKVLVALAAVGALAACGADADKDGTADGEPGGKAPGKAAGKSGKKDAKSGEDKAAKSSLRTKLTVPAGFVNTKGWQAGTDDYTTSLALPKSNAVAGLKWTSEKDELVVSVRNAKTGRPTWTSAPLKQPKGAFGSAKYLGSDQTAFVAVVDGKEYLVVWAKTAGKEDALNKNSGKGYAVDIYAADGSGKNVEPTAHAEVPDEYPSRVYAAGNAIVAVQQDNEVPMSIDPLSGKAAPLKLADVKAPADCADCEGDTLVAVAGKKPIVADGGTFWMDGGWSGASVAPPKADPERAKAWPATEGRLLVEWEEADDGDGNLWAVHDAETGKVQATVMCPKEAGLGDIRDPESAISPNGTYLVADHTVFDLDGGTGQCFEETGDKKPLTFQAVSDQGIAYGGSESVAVKRSPSDALVELRIGGDGGGEPKVLPKGTAVPYAVLDGVGLFRSTNDSGRRESVIAYTQNAG